MPENDREKLGAELRDRLADAGLICADCRYPIWEGAKFCVNCGKAVERKETDPARIEVLKAELKELDTGARAPVDLYETVNMAGSSTTVYRCLKCDFRREYNTRSRNSHLTYCPDCGATLRYFGSGIACVVD